MVNDLIKLGLFVCILYLNDSSRLWGEFYISLWFLDCIVGWINFFIFSSMWFFCVFYWKRYIEGFEVRIVFSVVLKWIWFMIVFEIFFLFSIWIIVLFVWISLRSCCKLEFVIRCLMYLRKLIFIWNLFSFSIIDLILFLLGLFRMMLSIFYYSGW